jgi:opacity protein-like surface antigen
MKYLYIIIMVVALCANANAGELSVGAGLMDGHSDTQGRCINPGYSADIQYVETIAGFGLVHLDAGGLFTFSRYETASRETVGSHEYDQRTDTSLTLSAVIKPTLRISRLSVYYVFGIGPDWMEGKGEGLDYGWLTGVGLSFKLTDRVSIGVTERRYSRHDTGNYHNQTGYITMTF